MNDTDPPFAGMFDTFCPMHAILNRTGHIVHAGPTLRRLASDADVTGLRFLELLELKRPRVSHSMQDLLDLAGTRLHFKLRGAPGTELKGVLAPLPPGTGPDGGAVVNLSFGISILEAVTDFSLTSADFAPTDLTIEMLYLVEAKSAAMEASRKLNLRLQGARIAAEEQAFTDTLTGLRNRRAMECVLERLISGERDFALMHLDLDFFKAVNDNLGHAAGDHVLQEVARIMVAETRSNDTIVRAGGDEFVLIFEDLTRHSSVSEIADRLIARLEEPIDFKGQTCRVSASIGAVLTVDYTRPAVAQMMEDADIALYAAKEAGRGCHRLYTGAMRAAAKPHTPARSARA